MSRLVCWWLDVHPVGEAFVVTTAPTFPQVRAILWREINIAHSKGKLLGDTSEVEWKMNGQLVAFGRKPSDYDPGAFQGIHARYVLVVIDEACAVPVNLWDAADTLITGEDCRIVAIGNPDDPASEFAKVCAPGSGWNNIRISAFESPNFTDEKDEVPPEVLGLLTSPMWVEEKRKKWRPGQHPFWESKILGEFPEQAKDALIPLSALRRAHQAWDDMRFLHIREPNMLSCDVARFGDDETIIMHRLGKTARVVESYGKLDTMETAGHLIRVRRETGADTIAVDDDGVGGGVVDRLNELDEPVRPMKGGTRSLEPNQYLNQRAERFWNLRETFLDDEIAIDPADEELSSQLVGLKWKVTSRGQIQMETKEEMKKRGMDSPDRADALAMIFAPMIRDFDTIWDIHRCIKCGHGFILDAAMKQRACPNCGTVNTYRKSSVEPEAELEEAAT